MLRELPKDATRFAIDGVLITAASLGLVARAERVLREARLRATQIVADANGEAKKNHREAREQGYADGLHIALRSVLAALGDVRATENRWVASAIERAKQAVSVALQEAGAESWLVEHFCREACLRAEAWPVLRLRGDQGALAEQLCAMQGLERLRLICRDGGPCVLDTGAVVIEFALDAGVERAVDEVSMSDELVGAVRSLASQWSVCATDSVWHRYERRERMAQRLRA